MKTAPCLPSLSACEISEYFHTLLRNSWPLEQIENECLVDSHTSIFPADGHWSPRQPIRARRAGLRLGPDLRPVQGPVQDSRSGRGGSGPRGAIIGPDRLPVRNGERQPLELPVREPQSAEVRRGRLGGARQQHPRRMGGALHLQERQVSGLRLSRTRRLGPSREQMGGAARRRPRFLMNKWEEQPAADRAF